MTGCAVRTASANGPPPGTMTTRPGTLRTASSHAVRSEEKAWLPPSLTTIGLSAPAILLGGLLRTGPGDRIKMVDVGHFGGPFAPDFHPDRPRPRVKLLDPHRRGGPPRVGQHQGGNSLGQR